MVSRRFQCFHANITARIAGDQKRIVYAAAIPSKNIFFSCFCTNPSVAPIAFEEAGFRSSRLCRSQGKLQQIGKAQRLELSSQYLGAT